MVAGILVAFLYKGAKGKAGMLRGDGSLLWSKEGLHNH